LGEVVYGLGKLRARCAGRSPWCAGRP